MVNHYSRAGLSSLDVPSWEHPSNAACAPRGKSTWDRERLVCQFQGIDGCSRTDAERQVDAYERSFSSAIASAPAVGHGLGKNR
jgi:hypothetical protein